MANKVTIFQNEQFGEVRIAMVNGEPWFVAADVCRALEIKNPSDALTRLDDDERSILVLTEGTSLKGGNPNVNAVNEPGLYSLVLGSRKPEAKVFKRWITHEVIPSIRRTGAYMTTDVWETVRTDPRAMAKLLIEYADEIDRRKEAERKNAELQEAIEVQKLQIAEMCPKTTYYDVVLACKDLLSITQIAKDYGWSARRLNQWLEEQDVQFRQGKLWILYQKYAKQGYTSTKTHVHTGKDGQSHSSVHTYWTQSGRLFIYGLMKAAGNLPIVEWEDCDKEEQE